MTALMEAILRHAVAKPNAIAIDGGELGKVSWRALADWVEECRSGLLAQCGTTGVVALATDHGIPGCIADLALLEAGLAALPLPAFFTGDQVAHALRTSGASAVVGAKNPNFPDAAPQFGLDRVGPFPCAGVPDRTAKISFTSGSTGTPKGICLSAEHLLQVAQAVVDTLGVSHAGRHLALLPPGILLENVAGFYATMLAGGTYVALPLAETGFADPFRPDFLKLLCVVAEQAITSLILVPEYLHGLVIAMEASGTRLPRLTLVAVGGARVPVELLERAASVGLPVRQGYGLTECSSVVALEAGVESERGSVGKSIGVNAIRIAEDGEIVLDGPFCLGAVGGDAPASPYATGDIGRIDDAGRLWIEGRKLNLIITSHGRNIAPEWVEGELLAQPAIGQAMVHGDGGPELGALIVPAHPGADIEAAVRAANAGLPVYARVTAHRTVAPFTPTNGMLTGNGRIRRAAITSAYLNGESNLPFFDQLVADTADAQKTLLAVPQLQAGLAGRIDRETYIAYLTQAYHHVRHTVPLLKASRERLDGKPHFASALDEYIEEETGHEHWILNDIAAAGGDAQAAAASMPNAATAAMVDYAYDAIRNGNAAAMFGMVYVLEGTSIAMASAGAAAVQASLDLPDNAFSYLTSHGALDVEHMKFFAKLMNGVDDAEDRAAIVAMARDMFRLFAGMFASIPMGRYDEAA